MEDATPVLVLRRALREGLVTIAAICALALIGHRRDRRCVIFVVLLVFSSDGGSFSDVGGMFFVMKSNVGMTSKLTP